MITNTASLFQDLCPHEAHAGTTPKRRLTIVRWKLRGARRRAESRSYHYEGIVAVQGLRELREALKAQIQGK